MVIKKHVREESGIALVIALVMLLVLTVIGITSVTTSTLDIQLSGNERRAAEALNLADAGIERGLHDLLWDYKHDTSWANNTLYRVNLDTGAGVTNALPGDAANNFGDFGCTPTPACLSPQFGDPFGGPNIGGSINKSVDPFGGTQTLGDGKYRVLFLRDADEPDEIYARSYAEHSTGARKILQLHMKMNKIDVWKNAIFAGRGSATASITGNIKVAGPVHVLGTGDTNEYTISGSSEIVNGYKGIGTASYSEGTLMDKIDLGSIEQVDIYNGQPVYSLESVFRVKNVQVKITGSGNIGEAGGSGALPDGIEQYGGLYFQSELDAIYANKAIVGASYYADEVVMPNGYDLGDKIQMPSFEDAYIDQSGGDWVTYEDYINTNSITIPTATACNLKTGAEGAAKTPTFCVGTVDDAACSAGDFTVACAAGSNGCIKWNPGTGAGATMYISGRVKFDNANCANTSYQMGSQGDAITYTGKGLLYGSKSFYMKGSLVTAGGGLGSQFIKDNLMGVLTKNNLHIAESGDPKAVVMAGLFAAGLISTEAPSQIIGSIVSNNFCLGGTQTVGGVTTCNAAGGGQASDIFYVPNLSEEVTKLGMIKGKVIYTFTTYDWDQVY